MPLALTARFTFQPEAILRDRRIHDIAHDMVAARMLALQDQLDRAPRAKSA